jgi:hypothetical protein
MVDIYVVCLRVCVYLCFYEWSPLFAYPFGGRDGGNAARLGHADQPHAGGAEAVLEQKLRHLRRLARPNVIHEEARARPRQKKSHTAADSLGSVCVCVLFFFLRARCWLVTTQQKNSQKQPKAVSAQNNVIHVNLVLP